MIHPHPHPRPTRRARLGALAALAAIIAAACTSGTSQPVSTSTVAPVTVAATTITSDEVRAVAHDALVGFSEGDYDTFARNWDSAMRAAIGPDAFRTFQQKTTADAGTYETIIAIDQRPGKTPDTTNFYVHASFTKRPMVLRLNYRNESRLISGVELIQQ